MNEFSALLIIVKKKNWKIFNSKIWTSIENSRMSSTLYDHLLLDVGDIRGVSIGMTLDRALDKFCLQM